MQRAWRLAALAVLLRRSVPPLPPAGRRTAPSGSAASTNGWTSSSSTAGPCGSAASRRPTGASPDLAGGAATSSSAARRPRRRTRAPRQRDGPMGARGRGQSGSPFRPRDRRNGRCGVLAAGYGRVRAGFRGARVRRRTASGRGRGARPPAAACGPIRATRSSRPSDAEALRRSGGRLVVIEGRVRRVGFGRSRLYLDIVQKGGPTIVVPRKLEPAFARAGHLPRRRGRPDDSGAGGAGQPFGSETRGQRAGDDRIPGSFAARRGRASRVHDRSRSRKSEASRWGAGGAGSCCAAALGLGLAACASVEPPPAPANVAAGAAPSRPAAPPASPERKRLIDAFGGEYRAPAAGRFLNSVLAQAGAGVGRGRASPIASRCSIRRSSTPSPCLRATSS